MKQLITATLLSSFACLCLGQEKPAVANPPRDALLQHLLDWPVMDITFDQALLRDWGAGGWNALDEKWKQAQSAEPRYALLRGLLAERQGNFLGAAQLFAELRNDDWAQYHRGRLMAFTGDVTAGQVELTNLAQRTQNPWLFRESALAMGEILQLQHGSVAAESFYSMLWDTRTDFCSRASIMEPLLSVLAQHGKARAWLDRLKPAADAVTKESDLNEVGMKRLWQGGSYLLDGRWDQRWNVPGLHEVPMLVPDEEADVETRASLASHFAQIQPPGDATISRILATSCDNGMLEFFKVALAVKQRLRACPKILRRAFERLQTEEEAAALHQFLVSEIFEASETTDWPLLSLWLRVRAGAPALSLHEDAVKLWESTRIDVSYPLLADTADGNFRASAVFLTELDQGRRRSPYMENPTPEIVWNLRGQGFTDAMSAQWKLGFEDHLDQYAGLLREQMLVVGSGASQPLDDTFYDIPCVWLGSQAKCWLWAHRGRFGLTTELLGPPGTGGDPRESAYDILLRGGTEDLMRLVEAESALTPLPTTTLVILAKALEFRLRQENTGVTAEDFEQRDLPVRKVRTQVIARHPGWLTLALQHGLPVAATPALTASEMSELLAAIKSKGRWPTNALRTAAAEKIWSSLDSTLQSRKQVEAAAYRTMWQRTENLRPHPLWNLDWRPSLLWDASLLALAPPKAATPTSRLPGPPAPVPTEADLLKKEIDAHAAAIRSALAIAYPTAFAFFGKPRRDEMRSYAAANPDVRDLLAVWDVLASVPRPVGTQKAPIPGASQDQLLAAFQSLQSSDTPRAKFTVALLLNALGHREEAWRLAGECRSLEGPLNQLAKVLASESSERPTVPPAYLSRPLPAPENMLASVLDDPANADLIQATDTSPILFSRVRNREAKLAVYDLLRQQMESETAFPLGARLMSGLARELGRPDDELAVIEEFDLDLNPDSPDARLIRAVRLAKSGDDDRALEEFLEALRRTDLAKPPLFDKRFFPPKESWMMRVEKAGCMGDFVSALTEAFGRTAPNAAQVLAADFCAAVFELEKPGLPPASLEGLLKLIAKQQPHLLRARFDRWRDTAISLESAGLTHVATPLARHLLLSQWPQNFVLHPGRSSFYAAHPPEGIREPLRNWGGGSGADEILPEAPIMPLFKLALQGEYKDFLASCEKTARENPRDEQMVSVFLLARVIHGPLPDDALKLADSLKPAEKCRVAWRLCELAPAQNVNLASLVPMLADGIKALFDDPINDSGTRDVMLARRLLAWIEKSGDAAQFTAMELLVSQRAALKESARWPKGRGQPSDAKKIGTP